MLFAVDAPVGRRFQNYKTKHDVPELALEEFLEIDGAARFSKDEEYILESDSKVFKRHFLNKGTKEEFIAQLEGFNNLFEHKNWRPDWDT